MNIKKCLLHIAVVLIFSLLSGCTNVNQDIDEYLYVSFSSEYGEVPEAIKVEKGHCLAGKEIAYPSSNFHDFTGWYDGETKVIPGEYTVEKDVVLVAKWKERYSTVIFVNSENKQDSFSKLYVQGTEITLPECPFEVPAGKKFAGWISTSSIDSSYVSTCKIENYTLEFEAVFIDSQSYSITYDKGGLFSARTEPGKNANPNYFYPSQKIVLSDLVCEGYIFGGWYATSDFSGSAIKGWNATEVNENVTLWAKWTAITYKVRFATQRTDVTVKMPDGTPITSEIDCTYDEKTEVPVCECSSDMWQFDSWNTKADGSGTKINDIYGLVKLSSVQDDTVILYAVWKSKKALDTIKNAEIFAVPAGIKLSWLNPSDESFEKVIISYDGKTKEVYATPGSETTIILDGFEYLHGYVFELRASYANGECSNYRRLKTSYVVHPLDSIGDKIRIKLPDMMCYRSDYQSCVNECNQMKTTSKFSVNIKTKKNFSKVYDVEGNSYDSESNLTVYKSTDGINWEVQASDRTDKDIWFWFPDAVQSQSLFYYIASDTVISSIMRVEIGTPVTEKMGGYVYSDFTVSKEKQREKTVIGRVTDVDYDGNAIAMIATKAGQVAKWSFTQSKVNFNTTPVRLSIDDGSYSWEDINENYIQTDISRNGFYYAVHCTDYDLKWHTPALNEFLKFQSVYFNCIDETNLGFMYSTSQKHFITLAFCSSQTTAKDQRVVYGVEPLHYGGADTAPRYSQYFDFNEYTKYGENQESAYKYVLPFANFHENVQKNLH